jgi:membrane protein required for colicin V production
LNWVDLAVVAVALISGLLGLARGFVRESLGVGAWVGAGYLAVKTAPLVRDKFTEWLGSPDLGNPVAHTVMFLVMLIILSLIAGWVGSLVQSVGLGGVDRSLGALFGVVRGFALVVVAYVLGGFVVAPDHWPESVGQARLRPYVADAAEWVTLQLPPAYRPALPGTGDTTPKLPQLLQALPQGRPRP